MEKLCQVTLSSLFNSDTRPHQSAQQINPDYLKQRLPYFYTFCLCSPHLGFQLLTFSVSFLQSPSFPAPVPPQTRNKTFISRIHSLIRCRELGDKLPKGQKVGSWTHYNLKRSNFLLQIAVLNKGVVKMVISNSDLFSSMEMHGPYMYAYWTHVVITYSCSHLHRCQNQMAQFGSTFPLSLIFYPHPVFSWFKMKVTCWPKILCWLWSIL